VYTGIIDGRSWSGRDSSKKRKVKREESGCAFGRNESATASDIKNFSLSPFLFSLPPPLASIAAAMAMPIPGAAI